ncbi:KAP family NTPase [Flavobacterium plurextorum]|uniref:KAP family NTPase n=1 Tax=Flavobacterium TaxID=237 RepID=UPI00214DD80B|nr:MULTISPECIES: KAP family NTPase [Flavobacterium]UUW09799.1 KAP family NTPase [Flavobacterium plurextorum]
MNTKYSYKILKEEVEVTDFYEEQTHENIKCSLLNLIKNEDEGITIGLSGPWGSGKSTIINLLKNDKENKDIFSFFYFDAWAHEGDPLRRIFLESLINSFKENEKDEVVISELEDKRKTISREKKTKHIKITRSTTSLGLILTIATLFFTIGVAILSSINYDNLTSESKYPINWAFVVGAILASLPFFVLLGNWISLLCKNEKATDLNNWSFLQNNSDETITEDVIGDDERSSIEFEKYFKEILEIYNTQKKRKIVIVLDNLDRVDANVSLRIWSTLQTFIQHKNPTSKDYNIFRNVFTIIPYDEQSLMKIWENYTENQDGSRSIDNKFASSFFDKSFQVRIDVPKPIISNWLDFIQKMVNKSFTVWEKTDKDVIVEVIEKTRKDILDNPKPREIKTYLNQIGFLRNHIPEQISTKSIALYVYKRYLQGNSNDEIANYLIDKTKILKEEINLIDDNIIEELAAIIYGVTKEKGTQILLTPKILEALNDDKPELLKDLITNYNSVFWYIFKNKITTTDNLIDYLKYCMPINKCFDSYDADINNNFIPSLSRYLTNEKIFSYHFDEYFVLNIKNATDLLKKFSRNEDIKRLWYFFINVYEYQEINNRGSEDFKNNGNTFFIDTLNYVFQKTEINFKVKTLNISFDSWELIGNHPSFSKISVFLHPSEENFIKTANLINPGTPIPDSIYPLLNSYIYHKSLNLEPILLNLKNHFSWNNGNQSGNIFVFKSIKLFENFFYNYSNYDYSDFLKLPQFYSVCHFTKSEDEKAINIIATICSVYYKEKNLLISTETPLTNSYANSFINELYNYWTKPNSDYAHCTYEILKTNNLLNIVWKLCTDSNNILCCDIIDLMVSNNDDEAFNIENPFDVLIDIDGIKKEEYEISGLVTKFLKCSNLENIFLAIDDLKLALNNRIIYEIIYDNKSPEIYKKVENELKKLDLEQLITSLNNNDYLFNILLIVKENNDLFSLDKLNNALYQFVYGSFLINNQVYILDDWHKDNWSKIIKLLDDIHYDNFCMRITDLLFREKENIKEDFFELNQEFINKNFLADLINRDKDSFALYIQEALQNSTNLEKLKFIEKLFKIDDEKKIKFDIGFKKLIMDNVLRLNAEDNSEELIRISSIIAKRFSISLKTVKDKPV